MRRVRVTGRVQGVSFRASCRDEARALGVSGWVRNLADGSVEAVFVGGTAEVEALIDWCRSGPRGARVEAIGSERIDAADLSTSDRPESGGVFAVR